MSERTESTERRGKKRKLEILVAQIPKVPRKVVEPLPDPCFLAIFTAPPRSGKTNFILNLIYNLDWKYEWNRVIFVSPTVLLDKSLKTVVEDADVEKFSDMDRLDSYIAEVLASTKKDERNLLILDDAVGFLKKNITTLCTRYRHHGISLVIAVQAFRACPNIARACASHYFIFKTNNEAEVEKMDEEFRGQFQTFKQMYEIATAEKYNFLMLSLRDSEAYKNLDTVLMSESTQT